MEHIGIDIHKRDSQSCIVAEGGELVEERIRTEPERFAAVLGKRNSSRFPVLAMTPWSGHRCASTRRCNDERRDPAAPV